MNPLRHVAIIMDGNGRWGLKNKNSRNLGHRQGLKTIEDIIKSSIDNKIKYLTLFAFSTENWKRPKGEIKYLFDLLKKFLLKKLDKLQKKNIKLKFIGNLNFDKNLKKILLFAEKKTSKNTELQINLAINYGSQDEILRAIYFLIKKKKKINQKNLSKSLYTGGLPDPDLLIRTGNTKRLSNFMLWQMAYTEFFFVKKLWPDFTTKDFKKIITQYKKIKRNFGSVDE